MRVIDYHMHTHFSGDSEANPREHVLKAIEMNFDEICFTDHRDFDYPIDSFELDVENYYQEIQSLKEEFKDQIKIKWGIEMGLDLDHQEEIENLIQQYPFDFVIGTLPQEQFFISSCRSFRSSCGRNTAAVSPGAGTPQVSRLSRAARMDSPLR